MKDQIENQGMAKPREYTQYPAPFLGALAELTQHYLYERLKNDALATKLLDSSILLEMAYQQSKFNNPEDREGIHRITTDMVLEATNVIMEAGGTFPGWENRW
jgi:hypothetical protein